MGRKRNRRAGGARCRSCDRPVVLLGHPTTGNWRTFEPTPVDGHNHPGEAYPAEGKRTYRLRDLIEELMIRRDCSYGEAETEARDMPWYVPHHCPPGTAALEPYRLDDQTTTPTTTEGTT